MDRFRRWPGLFDLKPCVILDDALPMPQVERLREAVLTSPYLAANTLNYRFSGTRGFSVIFRREGVAKLAVQFPAFHEYLQRVLHPRCNAFFLNPLVIVRGSRVAPHVDRSLRSWTAPDEPPDPVKVVVLYLNVPEQLEGGRLILHGRGPVAEIVPRVNRLAIFRGHLLHEVTELGGPEEVESARMSLVCEQYRLPPLLLERVPEYEIRTKRPFSEFFEEELNKDVTR